MEKKQKFFLLLKFQNVLGFIIFVTSPKGSGHPQLIGETGVQVLLLKKSNFISLPIKEPLMEQVKVSLKEPIRAVGAGQNERKRQKRMRVTNMGPTEPIRVLFKITYINERDKSFETPPKIVLPFSLPLPVHRLQQVVTVRPGKEQQKGHTLQTFTLVLKKFYSNYPW